MAMNKTSGKVLMVCIAVTLTVSSFILASAHGHACGGCEKKEEHKLSGMKVEGYEFPATIKEPGSNKIVILGGAGVSGLQIKDKFINFTTIGVYLDGDEAISSLSPKWKGKSTEELEDSLDFFMDIVTGGFEKLTRVTMILPLTGAEYSEKVMERCVAYLKAKETYTHAEAKAVEKFIEAFKDETFPRDSSIVFSQRCPRCLAIGFSKDSSIPEVSKTVIYNLPLAEAVLESIIGKNGVSPAVKKSLAARISVLLKEETGRVLDDETAAFQKSLDARISELLKEETGKVLDEETAARKRSFAQFRAWTEEVSEEVSLEENFFIPYYKQTEFSTPSEINERSTYTDISDRIEQILQTEFSTPQNVA